MASNISLHERMEKLERANRRWRCAALCTLLAMGGMLVAGQARGGGDVVNARALVIRDEAGKPRILLSAEEGEPGITIAHENGKSAFSILVRKDGSVDLGILDEKGRLRHALFTCPEHGTAYDLVDSAGKIRLTAYTQEKDSLSGLILRDASGMVRIRNVTLGDAGAISTMTDGAGVTRFLMGTRQGREGEAEPTPSALRELSLSMSRRGAPTVAPHTFTVLDATGSKTVRLTTKAPAQPTPPPPDASRPDFAHFFVVDAQGRPRIATGTGYNSPAIMGVLDTAGNSRILLQTTPEGDAVVMHLDAEGNIRSATGTHADGELIQEGAARPGPSEDAPEIEIEIE